MSETVRPEEFGDRVRIGANHNSTFHPSEVCRIDFDTDEGRYAIVVQRLGSVGTIIADLVDRDNPIDGRTRIGNWKSSYNEVTNV